MSNEDENMSDEDALLASQAYITFVQRFGEYVKEMDPILWGKAREYAIDFTNIPQTYTDLRIVGSTRDTVNDTDGGTLFKFNNFYNLE